MMGQISLKVFPPYPVNPPHPHRRQVARPNKAVDQLIVYPEKFSNFLQRKKRALCWQISHNFLFVSFYLECQYTISFILAMSKLFLFLRLRFLLPALVVLFLVWQLWLFFRPGPEPLGFGESRAAAVAIDRFVSQLSPERESQPIRVGVVALAGDRSGEVTALLRDALLRDRRFLVEQTSIPAKILSDIASALASASSLPEIAGAGRQIGIDLIVVGRVESISSSRDSARVDLQLSAYNTRKGAWTTRDQFRGDWQPGLIDGLQAGVEAQPIWQRLTLWLIFVLALPWITPWFSKAIARRASNTASALLILGYATLNLTAAAFLIGFSLAGFLPWLGFLTATLFAVAYPWWSCEMIASGER
jgi:hypothetical protein